MIPLSWLQYGLIGLAALAAGVVNALAGGGTLITFPLLTALGLPAVVANVTNTIALCPGYFGGTLAQKDELRGQRTRLLWFLPAAVIGGLVGGLLLLHSGERLFRSLVPYLILLASLLLLLSEPLRKWLKHSPAGAEHAKKYIWLGLPLVTAAAAYGGYFGAGLGVLFLAILALLFRDSLTHLNALKQALSLAANVTAALLFVFSGPVNWGVAAWMAVCALTGGWLGGKLAGKVSPRLLRWGVVCIGVTIAVTTFLRG